MIELLREVKVRTYLIVGLIILYIILGIVDIRGQNISTGIASLGLALVNGLLFFAGGK